MRKVLALAMSLGILGKPRGQVFSGAIRAIPPKPRSQGDRFFLAPLLAALACSTLHESYGETSTPSPVPAGYTLVWSDEFEDGSLDLDRWVHRTSAVTRKGEKVSVCLPRNVSMENGKLAITLRKGDHDGYPFTCGGAITKRRFRDGYYETRARMAKGQGWHEAFWTTWSVNFKPTDEERAMIEKEGSIEIDAFEHYAGHDSTTFCYGLIQWHPRRANLSRDTVTSREDLAERFHTYAFELTPDYLCFFFDGKRLKTLDMRALPRNEFHIWLTCVVTQLETAPVRDDACYFDYLRCYEIDLGSEVYRRRRDRLLTELEGQRGTVKSSGIDLWLEAESFAQKGAWEDTHDGTARVLQGRTGKDNEGSTGLRAATAVRVEHAGKYRLWVRSRDFARKQPGARHFLVGVNGVVSDMRFGAHGSEGHAWQDGGVYEIPRGSATIELVDSSQYYARCDRLLLTTDMDFIPRGLGGTENAEHMPVPSRTQGSAGD